MSKESSEARRAYKREWNRAHPEQVRAAQARYWEKKAAESGAVNISDPGSPGDSAAEARRAYKREWTRQNRDKVRAAQERYWKRKAEQTRAAELAELAALKEERKADAGKDHNL